MLSQTTDWTVAVRLVIIVVVLYVTGAVGSHALARAALHDGAKPILADANGDLVPTECSEIDAELAARVAARLSAEKEAEQQESQPIAAGTEDSPSNS